MKQLFLISEHKPRLLLFFTGWGADEHLYRHLHPEDCDWMLCYDYRSPEFDAGLLADYREITLVAWSMGVWAAGEVLRRYPTLPVTRSIAINGTPFPIDEQRGIAPSVFNGTLQNLSPKNLHKFQRRMCGTAETHRAFLRMAPQRPIEELGEELAAIRRRYVPSDEPTFTWQTAVIGTQDRIFLPDNQRRAWSGRAVRIVEVDAPHYWEGFPIDYLENTKQSTASASEESRGLLARRFARAAETYSQEATIQRQIAEKMLRLLQQYIAPPCPEVYEFGCGTGIYSRLILQHLQPEKLWLNDLCPEMETYCKELLADRKVHFLAGDAESLPVPGTPSLITSCSTLQWFTSPERFFRKCADSLRPEGILAFTTFGERNMDELRTLTGNSLPYRTRHELEDALQPRFQLLHSEEGIMTRTFPHPTDVLRHLRQTGVNGSTSGNSLRTRRDLADFCQRYEQQYGNGSSVPLTYHPIYVIARIK